MILFEGKAAKEGVQSEIEERRKGRGEREN
jgi:hypothetical protein